MQGTFLRNLVFVVVLNLVVKPFYILGIDAGVQERVGAEVYGVYAALLSLSFLLNIVLDLGITNHNTRYLSQHPELMREQFAGIVGVRLVLVVLYASVCLCAGFVLGYGAEQLNLLGWLILNQALAAMLLYLRSNIAAMQRYAVDSLLSVLDRALLIGLVGWLLWGRGMHEEFRIEWFVRAQTLAYSASVFFAFVILRRSVDVLSLRWDRGRAWSILQQSFPYALLILLMTFYYRMDTLLLERLLPDGAMQAGIYAQAFRFFEAFNMFGYLLAGLLLPMFSRLIKSDGPVAPLAGMAFRLVWVGTLSAEAIGANAQLVRVGAYFHDIGMVDFSAFGRAMHPEFAAQALFDPALEDLIEAIWLENSGGLAWHLFALVQSGELGQDPRQVLRELAGPFDLIFNDVNKDGYPDSLPAIAEKLRPGGVLIVDNMLWHGRIFDPNDQNVATHGVRELTRLLATSPDWILSVLPIRDGLAVAFKK